MASRTNENKSKGQEIKIVCLKCKTETNYKVVTSVDVDGYEEESDIKWYENYQVVQCMGCDSLSFRIEKSDSEFHSYEDPYTEELYPRRSDKPLTSDAYQYLPFKVKQVYAETIEAYNNSMFILCSAGIRATIEAICIEKNVCDGPVTVIDVTTKKETTKQKDNLEGKINGLAEKGILTKANAEILHEHRSMGNESVHNISPHNKDIIMLALNIIENILESIYGIRSKSVKLKEERGTL